ncbi:MAG: hypothetical protein LBK54_03285 [Propionibacteriaceae bacterium]|jgi:hypothetical protein|nr:hypothetical protein [Propionibacteriaceae bacterium]
MKASEPETLARPQPRDFRLLLTGQIVTVLGSTLLRFALSLHILDSTGRVDLFAALFGRTTLRGESM